ncbi:YbaN family protein [Comamonas endophytica]|uniref:YbaN family protein n=1 Tax=Comamonas endophytica TaxID=2949090 RepID=A0ABY6GCI9_9BURK|nr:MULTISPECIES: YbaN family protein [unclassified Acidovorax]MCD2512904.1 YbaN family protein [Acidovorax sp. D4N7]UYG52749.1 YbaN family protein [Acidovorax sp. 5MLIR]
MNDPLCASTSACPGHRLPSWPVRCLLQAFAALCVVLGMVGAVVPGMPTTVFILMAAWAAMRSSPRFHAWLYAHATFGPMLRSWDDGGRVSRRVKWMATLSMSASSALIVYFVTKPWAAGLALLSMACVLVWLWLRPEPAASA